MKLVIIAMLAFQSMAQYATWNGEDNALRHYLRERRDNHLYSFDVNAQPFKPHHQERSRQSRYSHKREKSCSSKKSHKHAGHAKSDPCADPAYKDAPFCQKHVFTRAGEAIPIYWKNKEITVSPINNIVGGSIQLRTFDPLNANQKWIFAPVSEYMDNNQYYIINSTTNLALTANAYPSPLILQNKINAPNQIFYVRPQTDGSFFISAYGSDLYMDVQEVDSGSLPVLIIRNYEGDITQKWLLN